MNRYAPSANPLRRRADSFCDWAAEIKKLFSNSRFERACEKTPTEQDR